MEFTKQDLLQCDNLIKALNKGSFTLDGQEVLALSQAMRWLGQLQAVISASLNPKTEPPKEVKSPVTEPAKKTIKPTPEPTNGTRIRRFTG